MRARHECSRLAFGAEHGWNRIAAALTIDNNHLALAVLIASKAAVAAYLSDWRA